MRYRLRTLLIVLAVLPPLLAMGWLKYSEWIAERQRLVELARPPDFSFVIPAAGPGAIEGKFSAPAAWPDIPNQESEEQVFSFQMGFAR